MKELTEEDINNGVKAIVKYFFEDSSFRQVIILDKINDYIPESLENDRYLQFFGPEGEAPTAAIVLFENKNIAIKRVNGNVTTFVPIGIWNKTTGNLCFVEPFGTKLSKIAAMRSLTIKEYEMAKQNPFHQQFLKRISLLSHVMVLTDVTNSVAAIRYFFGVCEETFAKYNTALPEAYYLEPFTDIYFYRKYI